MQKKNSIDAIYQPILPYLTRVQRNIRREIRVENKTVSKIVDYLFQAKGKLLRPALTILAGKAVARGEDEASDEALVQLATAIELIHNASLVHDDILDDADLRREIPTLNKIYNNHVALLAGDVLFTEAFYLMTHSLRQEIIEPITKITSGMCQGELINELYPGDNLDFHTYLTVISLKTAGLMSGATQAGAKVFDAPQEVVEALGEYGRNVGLAYQIVDDYVDDETGSIEGFSLDYAFKAAEQARDSLKVLSSSIYKDKLLDIVDLFIEMAVQKDMSATVKLP